MLGRTEVSRTLLSSAATASQSHAAVEHLKCAQSYLRCAVRIKYISDFKNLTTTKKEYFTFVDMLG